jgi:hypothetical protein
MSRLTVACTALLLLLAAGPVSAQDWKAPDPKAEPWRDARLKIGPIFFNPTFQIKDFGVDDNVYNDPVQPRQDLTGTLAMESLAGLQVRALLVTVRQSNSYIWFRRERSERSVDGGLRATAELRLNRIRPWVNIERMKTHARGGYEIDARAGRDLPAVDLGTDIQFGWRLGASFGYRSQKVEYAEGEFFDGADLREVLDNKTDHRRGFARYQLTTFTNLIAGVQQTRERFVTNTLRDADSLYYYGGLESSSDAPLGLNLQVGWKEQRHKDPAVPDFKGLIANGSAGFLVSDMLRINLNGMRDTGMSYDEIYPYFVEEGGGVSTHLRFSEHFDLKFDARGSWLKYSVTVTGAKVDRTDRSVVAGGEFGYYFGGLSGTRVGIRYEYADRVSPIAQKNYKRSRFYSDFRLSF